MASYRGAGSWDGGPPGAEAEYQPTTVPEYRPVSTDYRPAAAPATDPWTGASYAQYPSSYDYTAYAVPPYSYGYDPSYYQRDGNYYKYDSTGYTQVQQSGYDYPNRTRSRTRSPIESRNRDPKRRSYSNARSISPYEKRDRSYSRSRDGSYEKGKRMSHSRSRSRNKKYSKYSSSDHSRSRSSSYSLKKRSKRSRSSSSSYKSSNRSVSKERSLSPRPKTKRLKSHSRSSSQSKSSDKKVVKDKYKSYSSKELKDKSYMLKDHTPPLKKTKVRVKTEKIDKSPNQKRFERSDTPPRNNKYKDRKSITPPKKSKESSLTPPKSYSRRRSSSSSSSQSRPSTPKKLKRRHSQSSKSRSRSNSSSNQSSSSSGSRSRRKRSRRKSKSEFRTKVRSKRRSVSRTPSNSPRMSKFTRKRSKTPRSSISRSRSNSRSPRKRNQSNTPSDDERRGQFTVADRKRFWKLHKTRQEDKQKIEKLKTPPKEIKPPPGAIESTAVDDIEYGDPPEVEGPNFAELLPPPDHLMHPSTSKSKSIPIPIKNDGSFLEMFKKMQEVTKKVEATEEKKTETKKPVLPFIGKRRGGRILKTGLVKKAKAIDEQPADNAPKDAWSLYMQEVKKYRETSCEEERKTRPLVK